MSRHERSIEVSSDPLADDVQLVSAALRGEARAVRAIWDRHAPLVRRIVGRSLGPYYDTEDVVQDVFFHLFRKLGALREPAALRSYLISICVHSVRQEIRKRQVRRLISLRPTSELPDVRTTSTDHESRQALLGLYRMLERLPFREREAFALRHVEGMDLEGVAAALEISLPTLRRSLNKAHERLTRWSRDDATLSFYLMVRK